MEDPDASSPSHRPVPPDGGWGWVVVFASFVVSLVADGVSMSFGILYIDLLDYFGESKGKTAWVGSLFFSLPLLTGPVASSLTDRYGCRGVCIVGALLATAGFVASCFGTSLEFLFLTFSTSGFGLALCYVTSVVVVARHFEKRRSLATGLAVCGTGMGTSVFALLTSRLLDAFAWRGTLLLSAGFFLNLVVCGALMRDPDATPEGDRMPSRTRRLCNSLVQLPTYVTDVIPEDSSGEEGHPCPEASSPERAGERRTDQVGQRASLSQRGSVTFRGAVLADVRRRGPRASSCPDIYRDGTLGEEDKTCQILSELRYVLLDSLDMSLLRNGRYALLCFSNFLLSACVDNPYVYVPDSAMVLGVSKEHASFLIACIGLLNTVGVVLVGYLGDKPWMEPTLLYGLLTVASGAAVGAIPLVRSYAALAVLSALYGFTISANYTLVPVILVDIISLEHFTGAYGLLLMIQGLASLMGPPIAGWLCDATGAYDATFFFSGVCILASGIVVLPVARLRRRALAAYDASSPSESPGGDDSKRRGIDRNVTEDGEPPPCETEALVRNGAT